MTDGQMIAMIMLGAMGIGGLVLCLIESIFHGDDKYDR